MSETTNFNAAISRLRVMLEVDDQAVNDGGEFGIDTQVDSAREWIEIESAIHVLEAAGKIDEDDYFWAGRGSVSGNTIDLLAIILATLAEPDGGKR